MVATTVSWRAGWTRPRRAVQRARLCASTLQAGQAPLVGNRPEGQRLSPDPSLRSLMASSTVAWPRWYASAALVSRSSLSVTKQWWRQSGHSSRCALSRRQLAPHDEPQLRGRAVVAAELVAAAAGGDGGLSHLGLAAAGVGDRLPGVVVYGRYGCFDRGVLGDRDRVGRAVGADGRDHRVGEEPRVGAHRHARVGRQAPHPRQGLTSEAPVAALRQSRPHPRVQHLRAV